MDEQLEISGTTPEIAGGICESVMVESYEFKGVPQPSLIAAYLKFGKQWYRLYFDCGIIFWRSQEDAPKTWEVPEEGWVYPVQNLQGSSGIIGTRLMKYTMASTASGSYVDFEFESGRHLLLEDKADVTTCKVI